MLGDVPGVEVSAGDGTVTAWVPAIGDGPRLAVGDVLEAGPVASPTGLPAVHVGMRRGHEQLPLIVTVDDVVFAPSYAADMLADGAPVRVPSAPDLVAYSEMHRDVRALGRTIDEPDVELDQETLAATLLAGDFGRRVTGFGFVLFCAVAVAWAVSGLTDRPPSYPIAIMNALLLAINAWGVWQFLLNPKKKREIERAEQIADKAEADVEAGRA